MLTMKKSRLAMKVATHTTSRTRVLSVARSGVGP